MHYNRWHRHGNTDLAKAKRKCTLEGCDRPRAAHGYCIAHLNRVNRYGDPQADKPIKTRSRGGPVCAVEGCETRSGTALYCPKHQARVRRNGEPGPAGPMIAPVGERRYKNREGYIIVSGSSHNRTTQQGVLEHRLIMEQILGRPLRKGENVHHKNGVRDDNRPENLELWITSQPSGQRVEDKIEWARMILAEYGDLFGSVQA